jgi:hypothetical protein
VVLKLPYGIGSGGDLAAHPRNLEASGSAPSTARLPAQPGAVPAPTPAGEPMRDPLQGLLYLGRRQRIALLGLSRILLNREDESVMN